jgi:hypothetical protein
MTASVNNPKSHVRLLHGVVHGSGLNHVTVTVNFKLVTEVLMTVGVREHVTRLR